MAGAKGVKSKRKASKRKAAKRKPVKTRATKAKGRKAAERKSAWPERVDRFATILENRGDDEKACRDLERAIGGKPDRVTPYTVGTFSTRRAAEALAKRFTDIDAKASVEP